MSTRTILDMTPEECRALGREMASKAMAAAEDEARTERIFERWAPLLQRLADNPTPPTKGAA